MAARLDERERRQMVGTSFPATVTRGAATVRKGIAGTAPTKGGILEALRRSPLVGNDAVASRPFETGRKVDL